MSKKLWTIFAFWAILDYPSAILSQDDPFSRLIEDSGSGVQYNFYNFRPPSDQSGHPDPPMGHGFHEGAGVGVGVNFQEDPIKRRTADSYEDVNHPDPRFQNSRERREEEYGRRRQENGDENEWRVDNSLQNKNSYEVDREVRRKWEEDWRNVQKEESRDPPPQSPPGHKMKRGRGAETGRWDRTGLPMDVSWNQHNVHGKSARDGGMFGHKVTKMWHVMPQGGFIMTEQREPDPTANYYGQSHLGNGRRSTPTPSTTTTKRPKGRKRKVISVLDINGDMMEERLRQRIQKLQAMMQILQTRKNLKSIRST